MVTTSSVKRKSRRVAVRCTEETWRGFRKIAADLGGTQEDALEFYVNNYADFKKYGRNMPDKGNVV